MNNKYTPEQPLNESAYACGLDFGTSNSVITLTDPVTQQEVFTYTANSILYFPEDGNAACYVGKEAQDKYVEDRMTGRLIKSVKTLLPQDNFIFIWIAGRKVTPDQLVTYIIKHLKEKAELFTGSTITDVVLGRPAVFSEDPQKEQVAVNRLLLAARNAGFKNIKLQMEPIAAAYSYKKELKRDETVLVADFGGGTSDFTIIHLHPNHPDNTNAENKIMAHGGVYIGGDIFDSEIMWHKVTPELGRGVLYHSYDKMIEVPANLYRELRNWEKSFLLKESKSRRLMDKYYIFSGKNPKIDNVRVLVDNNYVYSLFKEIEKAKITLSTRPATNIKFSKKTIQIDKPILFEEYDSIIEKHTDQIENYILNLLHSVKYKSSDIDSVFLTGGSSLSLPVRKILIRLFGEEKLRQGDTFNSVAQGLSMEAAKAW